MNTLAESPGAARPAPLPAPGCACLRHRSAMEYGSQEIGDYGEERRLPSQRRHRTGAPFSSKKIGCRANVGKRKGCSAKCPQTPPKKTMTCSCQVCHVAKEAASAQASLGSCDDSKAAPPNVRVSQNFPGTIHLLQPSFRYLLVPRKCCTRATRG